MRPLGLVDGVLEGMFGEVLDTHGSKDGLTGGAVATFDAGGREGAADIFWSELVDGAMDGIIEGQIPIPEPPQTGLGTSAKAGDEEKSPNNTTKKTPTMVLKIEDPKPILNPW